jgi:hypothetical protein
VNGAGLAGELAGEEGQTPVDDDRSLPPLE